MAQIKTFQELTTPDERTLRFTPMGFSTTGMLKPEYAAEFQQQVIAHCDLHEDVTEDIRKSFERLRTLHSYGILCYEAFTAAHDLAWLVLEQALRDRFIAFYNGDIPLVNKKGEEKRLTASNFDVVYAAFHGGCLSKGEWQLQLSSGTKMDFRGSMSQLLDWARREHLLDGQRSKRLDPLFVSMRNDVAHPHYHLVTPVDSAQTIRDLAEIINRLWGHRTPGGRLYPAPIERDVLIVAWTAKEQGITRTILRDYQLEEFTEPGDWTCVIIRGVFEDEGVWEFDAQYERTKWPAELLWGPGSREEALQWLKEAAPEHDTVEYLDRLFALRIHDGKVSLPRRPEIALALPAGRREGEWRIVRADFPNDAFAHVRHIKDGFCCRDPDPQQGCAVEDVLEGDWQSVADQLAERFKIIGSAELSSVRVHPRRGVAPDVEAE
jgi:hypothetical protein